MTDEKTRRRLFGMADCPADGRPPLALLCPAPVLGDSCRQLDSRQDRPVSLPVILGGVMFVGLSLIAAGAGLWWWQERELGKWPCSHNPNLDAVAVLLIALGLMVSCAGVGGIIVLGSL